MTGARFVSLAAGDGYELAPGAIARALFGERGMLNLPSPSSSSIRADGNDSRCRSACCQGM